MESFLRQDEFDERILKEGRPLVKKSFKNAKNRSSEILQDELDKIFFRILRTHKVLAEISETTGIKGEIVKVLLRSCLRYAYREYNGFLDIMDFWQILLMERMVPLYRISPCTPEKVVEVVNEFKNETQTTDGSSIGSKSSSKRKEVDQKLDHKNDNIKVNEDHRSSTL
ncbi:unnamed protein product [Rhizophagus irregularis]|nr:unnamed protein product [Rhizophagus irregularis]